MAPKKTTSKPIVSVKKTSPKKSTSKKMKDSVVMMDTPMKSENATMSSPRMERNKQLYMLVGLAIVVGLLYYGRGLFVAAMVNGSPISRLAVIKSLEQQGGKGALDGIISEKLLKQEAQKKGVSVTKAEVDTRIADIEKELKASGQSLDKLLEMQGISMQQVREQTELQLLLKKVLADKIKVTDAEVDAAVKEQIASKPETVSDAEFKKQIKDGLENQKLSFEAQSYIQELQSKAKINYIHKY
ncbi:SurA N-terminal domain-containing protein [Candidatus Woesebacteria bacterium]|nr:SurA N-terminal domain-containing protein [Candidatus Woesebacteria bacterium]